MSRSLFRRLKRRFGRRISGAERVERAEAHRARIGEFLPLGLMTQKAPAGKEPPIRVAIVGGGFAGLAAARVLVNLNCRVMLFEARDTLAGRVRSTKSFISGRILEEGAELIGSNHPVWLDLARVFGLGLSVITEDDEFGAAGLSIPIRFLGKRLSQKEVEDLFRVMERALEDLTVRAKAITDPYNPWITPGADVLDKSTLESWIKGVTKDKVVQAALEFEFANNNVAPTKNQSLLAVLTQIAGGGLEHYWEDTEVFRCANGNDVLDGMSGLTRGKDLLMRHQVTEINIRGKEVEVKTMQKGDPRTTVHDFVIIAVPPSVWSSIQLNGSVIPIPKMQMGDAVKYLAETERRFWILNGDAPSGAADDMGMIWEGTDNQMGGSGIDLTVFAGGPFAAIGSTPPRDHFDPKIDKLLSGYKSSKVHAQFVNWPGVNFIHTGYSIPAPKQVITIGLWLQQSIAGRIWFAGEHVSMPFFGYMEGALQSGLIAAARVADAAGIVLPKSVTLSGSGVRVRFPKVVPPLPKVKK